MLSRGWSLLCCIFLVNEEGWGVPLVSPAPRDSGEGPAGRAFPPQGLLQQLRPPLSPRPRGALERRPIRALADARNRMGHGCRGPPRSRNLLLRFRPSPPRAPLRAGG